MISRIVSSADRGLQIQMVVAPEAGLLALLVATELALYKTPRHDRAWTA